MKSAIRIAHTLYSFLFSAVLMLSWSTTVSAQVSPGQAQRCENLLDLRSLTLTRAEIAENPQDGSSYCYVRGIISPAIHFHAQLPLPENWNGRFLQWGDGGKDGDLDYANHRVAEGYAVTNSNMGHDNGVEPGASFAFNNRQAEIDFGYRVPGSAIAIADGWVLGSRRESGGYAIYRWNGHDWDQAPGGAVEIGGTYNRPWVINNRGQRFIWNGRDWNRDFVSGGRGAYRFNDRRFNNRGINDRRFNDRGFSRGFRQDNRNPFRGRGFNGRQRDRNVWDRNRGNRGWGFDRRQRGDYRNRYDRRQRGDYRGRNFWNW